MLTYQCHYFLIHRFLLLFFEFTLPIFLLFFLRLFFPHPWIEYFYTLIINLSSLYIKPITNVNKLLKPVLRLLLTWILIWPMWMLYCATEKPPLALKFLFLFFKTRLSYIITMWFSHLIIFWQKSVPHPYSVFPNCSKIWCLPLVSLNQDVSKVHTVFGGCVS